MKYTPRRPLNPDEPNGYLESDTDYLLNNRELAVVLLDHHERMIAALLALTTYEGSTMVRSVAQRALPKELT